MTNRPLLALTSNGLYCSGDFYIDPNQSNER